ncbi:hypothetical protein H671_3g10180 [Cricetulus griseus]|nr:hypothetical protein H671_3g10180 [Cricetulus griseus]
MCGSAPRQPQGSEWISVVQTWKLMSNPQPWGIMCTYRDHPGPLHSPDKCLYSPSLNRDRWKESCKGPWSTFHVLRETSVWSEVVPLLLHLLLKRAVPSKAHLRSREHCLMSRGFQQAMIAIQLSHALSQLEVVVSRCKQQTLMPPATAMRCSCHQAFSATMGCAPLNQEAQQTADCLLLLRHLVAVIKDNLTVKTNQDTPQEDTNMALPGFGWLASCPQTGRDQNSRTEGSFYPEEAQGGVKTGSECRYMTPSAICTIRDSQHQLSRFQEHHKTGTIQKRGLWHNLNL